MKKQKKPIELYYWPTPNGWKISIMLEECKIPYILKPINIGKGDQFKPKFLKNGSFFDFFLSNSIDGQEFSCAVRSVRGCEMSFIEEYLGFS